jgi:hypothetical protein
MLNTGLSRRKVVLYLYAVTLIFLAMGFAAFWSRGHLVPVLLGLATLILLLCAGRLHFSRHWFAVGRMVGNSLEMRQEIHYALTLMRWLALEGGRRDSAEELYSDLVFAAERLGYSSVKLTLADGERVWERAKGCQTNRAVVQVLHGGDFGTLELKAPSCGITPDPAPWTQTCGRSFCPCVLDERVFEIVSELVAEGWVNAARKFKNSDPTPLGFDSQSAVPKYPMQRKSASSFAPAPVHEMGRKPASSP